MKFYEIDRALQESVTAADKPVRLKIEIELDGYYQSVHDSNIIEANFYSLKEASRGVASRGDVLIDNQSGFLTSRAGYGSGSPVKVLFSIGEGLSYFQRFLFYIDEKGIQEIKRDGGKKFVQIGLRDLSYKLRKTDEARDWTSHAVFTYSVVSDKTKPEKSIVHGIAKRAGLAVNDIDCSTIPVTLPYVRLRKNIWAELSSLAAAYRCHLECAPEKPLVFARSPYQNEPLIDNENSYSFTGSDIFYLRKTDKAELYRNTVRLKVNIPVSLEKQEIWRYDEPPVFYNDSMRPYYPFKYPLEREIETSKHEAKYRIIGADGKERNVVFADEIDSKEEAERRLEYDVGDFSYSRYDVTTNYDMAVLTLKKENDGNLFKAAIYGRPIILDINRSCFARDEAGIALYGTVALNITGSYFSEDKINGIQHYEDWVTRELAERTQNRREFTIKTHRGVFNSRVGAKVKIKLKNEILAGTIISLSYRYKRDKAFIAMFKIMEEL